MTQVERGRHRRPDRHVGRHVTEQIPVVRSDNYDPMYRGGLNLSHTEEETVKLLAARTKPPMFPNPIEPLVAERHPELPPRNDVPRRWVLWFWISVATLVMLVCAAGAIYIVNTPAPVVVQQKCPPAPVSDQR